MLKYILIRLVILIYFIKDELTVVAFGKNFGEYKEAFKACNVKLEHEHAHNCDPVHCAKNVKDTYNEKTLSKFKSYYFNYSDNRRHEDCFGKCILEELKLVKNNDFDVPAVLNQLGGITEVTKKTVTKCIAEQRVRLNKGAGPKKDANCQYLYFTVKCYFKIRSRESCDIAERTKT